MQVMLCALIGYFVGNINPAFILSKLKGFDIRQRGSGNAGASNTVITIGKKAGLFVALFDIAKAVAASLIAYYLFPEIKFAKILSGSCCILGHIFPILMKFHGGKGLASLGGTILAFNPILFITMLMFEIFLGFSLDYVCVVPITGSVIFTLAYALMTGDPIGTSILSVVSLIILFKHIENFKRIQNGTEAHISFLWKKDQEIARIRKNTND
ncbi:MULTISPECIES: glycerol-3-phosphate acyltransferase [Ruminococcus]|uniref:Glycerol-3-phosphate acyltransferase n=1 Tax=Ruminococcus flavefaciens TaxID=1265 RepID=A0A1M7KNB0_RUMFL|nr:MULTISPECIES: glycerol-3-phosphate acyltransferase [Ruminococcus]MCR4794776.1 glycerol-3-phosphate acyltransferase [Ruminococcus sp.]SHM66655.1 glycerol-3-phosphate acyltransferase PlsY [Ruminococcus flavefaciens]